MTLAGTLLLQGTGSFYLGDFVAAREYLELALESYDSEHHLLLVY